jgi:hypothetical protein
MDIIKLSVTNILLAVVVVVCSIFVLDKIFGIKPSTNEPPYIPPRFPLIGHAIGLLRKKYDYYLELRYLIPTLMLIGFPRTI